jgi:hypothetical protein
MVSLFVSLLLTAFNEPLFGPLIANQEKKRRSLDFQAGVAWTMSKLSCQSRRRSEDPARRSRNLSRTTGILPVPEHGLEGRGTKFARRANILANGIAARTAAFAVRVPSLAMMLQTVVV